MRIIISISLILLFTNFSGCEKEDPLISGEVEGIVKDYTGLDGCGFIIELTNGEKLEPAQMADTGFVFYDGQRVVLTYTELTDMASICMVGKIVRIETIRETGCMKIQQLNIGCSWDDLPDDPFAVNSVTIKDDCLEISLSYGGGCEAHVFTMYLMPNRCGTPPVPPPSLVLCHESNGDMCEAYITETVSFSLTTLQSLGGNPITFSLSLNFDGSDFYREFTYKY